MIHDSVLLWRGGVVLTRDLLVAGDRSEFFGRVRRGEFTSILRGVYTPTPHWAAADPDQRHLLRVAGAAELDPSAIFSHYSAAAIWELPSIAAWPHRGHVLQNNPALRATTAVFARHLPREPLELERIGRFSVTGLARTVVDVAATAPFAYSVAMADAALRRVIHPDPSVPHVAITHDELRAEVASLPSRHGSARARRAVEFANGRADRAGESVSRCSMHIAKVSEPLLQVVLFGASGARYVSDFFWPERSHIGEFDGRHKYSDPRFLGGRTPEQALRDEKAREDDLRQAGYRFTRWGWDVATSPASLKAHLARSGIR